MRREPMAETRIIIIESTHGKITVKLEPADKTQQTRTDLLALIGMRAIRQAMEGKS